MKIKDNMVIRTILCVFYAYCGFVLSTYGYMLVYGIHELYPVSYTGGDIPYSEFFGVFAFLAFLIAIFPYDMLVLIFVVYKVKKHISRVIFSLVMGGFVFFEGRPIILKSTDIVIVLSYVYVLPFIVAIFTIKLEGLLLLFHKRLKSL